MTVIKHQQIDTAYNIYLALYQGLSDNNDDDAYKQFSPEFFDLNAIVVEEAVSSAAGLACMPHSNDLRSY